MNGAAIVHELSVTQSILEIALRHAESAGGGRITHLQLVIGQLSSMVDDTVQFYWDIISEGTAAQGATLHFRRIPAELLCSTCNQRYPLRHDSFACPTCGSTQGTIVSGDEFYLESIELETDLESPITSSEQPV